MKKVVIFIVVVCNVGIAVAQKKIKPVVKPTAVKAAMASPVFKSLADSFSYAVGYAVASNMKAQNNVRRINTSLMQKGFDDVYNGKQPVIEAAKLNDVLQRQSQIFAQEKAKEDQAVASKEVAKGVAFFSENKKRTGVISLPSGLQYEVMKKGDSSSAKPKIVDTVVVNYVGTFIDGREFENSYRSGQPAVFLLTEVIPGWTEILQLMSVGDRWKVYIPTELAYNLNPRDPKQIPPGAALVFELSLEGIKKVITQ